MSNCGLPRHMKERLVIIALVAALVFSPSGLASNGARESAIAATPATPRWERPIHAVAFTPDGKSLVGTYGDTIRLWDVSTGRLRALLRGHTDLVLAIAISSDGRTLVSGGADGTLRVWSLPAGAPKLVFRGDPHIVFSVALARDNRIVASGGSSDGAVRLWDIRSGRLVRMMKGHEGEVHSVALSPVGDLLASTSGQQYDEGVRLWDARTGQFKGRLGQERQVLFHEIAFSPNGRLIAGLDWSRYPSDRVRVFDVRSGDQVFGLEFTAASIAFSPNGKVLATGFEKAVSIWDLASTVEIRRIEGLADWVEALAYSPDGGLLASGSHDVRLWDVLTGSLKRTLR